MTKKTIFIQLIIFCLILFHSAGLAFTQSVPFETIGRGDISYYRYSDSDFSGAEMIIRDHKTWLWFWLLHTQGIQPSPPLPNVDFSRETVLAVLLGYQTSGGGPSIEIQSIEEVPTGAAGKGNTKGLRAIVAENREPGPLTVITNPYHIVKVASSKSIIFEHQPGGMTCMDNLPCGENEFCLFPEGQCSGAGSCTKKPDVCIEIYSPVCGCDMKTYGNQCEAYANGVSILSRGECPGVDGVK
jgi:hypothetical protein